MLDSVQTAPAAARPISDKQEVAVLVKAVVRVAEAWGLSNPQAAQLFDVPGPTWARMKAGQFRGRLDQDKVTRASLIIGIFKGLRLLFNGPLTLGWPTTANDGGLFAGQTPVSAMAQGGIPMMIAVRNHIDALRGGL